MAKRVTAPALIQPAGNKPKIIREFFGKVNTSTTEVSVAQMTSPEGWEEPGQTPEFNEYTVVLSGILRVKTRSESFDVAEGEAILIEKGEWVQYSSPYENGAEYIAICLPAFSPETVHRDEP